MNSRSVLLSLAFLGLFCFVAQAGVFSDGFRGTFGDIEETDTLDFIGGQTSGATASAGLEASFSTLEVTLGTYYESEDRYAVDITDLELNGIVGTDCTGTAVYEWDSAFLSQMEIPTYGYVPVGMIMGSLHLNSNALFVDSVLVDLPSSIDVSMSYNGLIVAPGGSKGSVTFVSFPSASISAEASAVPEPSTIACLLAGFGMLLVWRRRK